MLFKVFPCHLEPSQAPPTIMSFLACRSPASGDEQVGWEEVVSPFYRCKASQPIFVTFSPYWSWINPVRWMLFPFIRWGNWGLKSGETGSTRASGSKRPSSASLKCANEISPLGAGKTEPCCWPFLVAVENCLQNYVNNFLPVSQPMSVTLTLGSARCLALADAMFSNMLHKKACKVLVQSNLLLLMSLGTCGPHRRNKQACRMMDSWPTQLPCVWARPLTPSCHGWH